MKKQLRIMIRLLDIDPNNVLALDNKRMAVDNLH